MDRAFRRWTPLLAIAALLAAAWAAAVMASPQITRMPLPQLLHVEASPTARPTAPSAAATASPTQQATDVEAPSWTSGIAGMVAGAVIVIAGGIGLWTFVRDRARIRKSLNVRRPGRRRAGDRAAEVMAAVEAGLTALSDSDADPRRAVIGCWVRLEQAAAAAGTPRRIGDSPTDLVTRLLQSHQISVAVLDEFAAVYREARYAQHMIDDQMRRSAVAALRQLRVELARAEDTSAHLLVRSAAQPVDRGGS